MGILDAWHQLRDAEPGHRFREQHERTQSRPTAVKLALGAAGCILIAGGIAMLFIPGPGLLTIALGLAFVASRSYRLAAALDRGEQRVLLWRAHRRELHR